MAAAARSYPPPALHEARAKHLPLRAGEPAKLNPRRKWARETAAPIVTRVLAEHGVSPHAIAEAFGRPGDDKAGKAILEGCVPIHIGEIAFLAPFDAALIVLIELALERAVRELADAGVPSNDPRMTRIGIALDHLRIVARLIRAADR